MQVYIILDSSIWGELPNEIVDLILMHWRKSVQSRPYKEELLSNHQKVRNNRFFKAGVHINNMNISRKSTPAIRLSYASCGELFLFGDNDYIVYTTESYSVDNYNIFKKYYDTDLGKYFDMMISKANKHMHRFAMIPECISELGKKINKIKENKLVSGDVVYFDVNKTRGSTWGDFYEDCNYNHSGLRLVFGVTECQYPIYLCMACGELEFSRLTKIPHYVCNVNISDVIDLAREELNRSIKNKDILKKRSISK